jgi:hypothetical protein
VLFLRQLHAADVLLQRPAIRAELRTPHAHCD